MKDLFVYKNDNTFVGTLRVDSLSNNHPNFTVLEIKNSAGVLVDNLDLIGAFWQRNKYSMQELTTLCIANGLKVVSMDSNGGNSSTIISTRYAIVDATGSTKTFRIATNVTAAFKAGDVLKVYNADGTVFGTFTHASDSYSAPNTSIVVTEVLTDIAALSGKYIVNTSV